MKIILLIIMFLTACGREPKIKVIDQDFYKDAQIFLYSDNLSYGNILKIKNNEEEFDIDVSELKPWKVLFSNIDGNKNTIALGVYKKTPFHDEEARRVFFYTIDYKNKALRPKLRISRLYNPLINFTLLDVDKDGLDEIVAVEKNIEGKYEIGVYGWTNFAFERNYSSKVLDEEPKISGRDIIIDNEKTNLYLEGDEVLWKLIK